MHSGQRRRRSATVLCLSRSPPRQPRTLDPCRTASKRKNATTSSAEREWIEREACHCWPPTALLTANRACRHAPPQGARPDSAGGGDTKGELHHRLLGEPHAPLPLRTSSDQVSIRDASETLPRRFRDASATLMLLLETVPRQTEVFAL